ncbi:RPII140-upstream gene protein [Phlebotomus argentipes]|uniref:RPII140-upstream gene protein n=1 Tax=Phlebotomus argentipes TaxID=94469 RepID=UPI002892DCDE|nr:RPII140-upstream gene protein [Phlebotomus argentipes]
MLRSRVKYISIMGFLPVAFEKQDEVKESKTAKDFLTRTVEDDTGMDRLRTMFSLDADEYISPELQSIKQAGLTGLFIGVLYGGFIRSRKAYLDFMERNDATSFTSHWDAKKQLQNEVTTNFAKGAWRWGWRLGLFSTTYVGFITMFSVYRGKSTIFEYSLAGLTAGALYKMNLGLRGMMAGGFAGCLLGTVGGVVSLSILKVSGMSMEEVRYWQHKWKVDRDTKISKNIPGHMSSDKDLYMEAHIERVGGDASNLDHVDEKPKEAK